MTADWRELMGRATRLQFSTVEWSPLPDYVRSSGKMEIHIVGLRRSFVRGKPDVCLFVHCTPNSCTRSSGGVESGGALLGELLAGVGIADQ